MITLQGTGSGTRRIQGGSSGTIIRGLLPSENFSVMVVPKTVLLEGSSSGSTTVQDAVLDIFTTAMTATLADVRAMVPMGGYATGPAQFASSDRDVLTIDPSSGTAAFAGPGTATVTINVPGIGIAVVLVTVVEQDSVTTDMLVNFVSGSLAAALAANVASAIYMRSPPSFSGGPPPYTYSSQINLFQTTGARNASGWWSGIDVTGISTGPYFGRPGTLVTKRDLISAYHFWGYSTTAPIGQSVTFQDNSNNIVTGTIAAASVLASPVGNIGSDILVLTLSEDVPSGITPFQVLPSDFRSYLPQPQYGYRCAFTNQDKTLLIGDVTITGPDYFMIVQSADPTCSYWWYSPRSGDSASAILMLINGAFVFVTYWYAVGAGPLVPDNISQINAAIASNGSPYEVSAVDLTSPTDYPTYP